MKSKVLVTIMAMFLLAACSNVKNTDSTNTDTQRLEQFQGYVAEKGTEDDGKEKVLVVKGITQEDALNATYDDVDTENIIWFVNEEGLFNEIEKGEQVNVWWDHSKPHVEPGILTLEAEKVEVIQELEESISATKNSNEEKSNVVQGYIVRKDEGSIRVMTHITKEEIIGKNQAGLEAHLRKHYDSQGYNFNLAAIDEKTKLSLQIGQKVMIKANGIHFTSPLSGDALEISIIEE